MQSDAALVKAVDTLWHDSMSTHTHYEAQPNLNALAERFIGSIRRELLSRVVRLAKGHLRWLVREYLAHYNAGRPHQGIANVPLGQRVGKVPLGQGEAANEAPATSIVCRKRAGGMLVSWHRQAG